MALLRARGAVTALDPALLVLAFIGFISQVGIAVMLPLLPLYATELGATPFVLGLLTSSFAVTNGVAQLITGFLTDRWGSRRFITGGLGLYAGMNLLIATATTAPWVLAWRSLAGLGGGAMLVAERIYLTEITHPSRRAFANGIISAAQSAGSVAGPAVGGLIAAVAGLRAPFLLVAATSGIALIGTFFLPNPAHRKPSASGAEAADTAGEEPIAYGPIGALLVANLALMAGYGGFITTYAPLATERLGWSTFDIGLAFSFFGIGSIVLGPPIAHFADRVGRRGVAMVSSLPIALFGLALVLELPLPAVWAISILSGAGLTGFSASWYALLADVSGVRRRGRIFGVVSALSNAGIVIGAMVAAQLWERVDIGVALLSSSVAVLIAGSALAAFRAPSRAPLTQGSDR